MAADDCNAFEVYRDRVDRPLLRLVREYGAGEAHWLVIGMAANVVARVAGLVPPVVLGVAIDAVFIGDGPYTLPVVPDAWLPADGLYVKLWGVQAGEIEELPEEFVDRARERHVDRAVERAMGKEAVESEALDD